MKEHPILFSGPMVRAILEGRKTQTRRIVAKHEIERLSSRDEFASSGPHQLSTRETPGYAYVRLTDGLFVGLPCPYGQPGDRLWVRETTRQRYLPNILTGEPTNALCGEYVADDEPAFDPKGFDYAWWYSRKTCPAIHMPRWASRLTLEVTGVRVERLQDITEADAVAEGLRAVVGDGTGRGPGCKWNGIGYEGAKPHFFHVPHPEEPRCYCKLAGPTPVQCAYRDLWDSINAKRAPWASNPWMWVVAFRKMP